MAMIVSTIFGFLGDFIVFECAILLTAVVTTQEYKFTGVLTPLKTGIVWMWRLKTVIIF